MDKNNGYYKFNCETKGIMYGVFMFWINNNFCDSRMRWFLLWWRTAWLGDYIGGKWITQSGSVNVVMSGACSMPKGDWMVEFLDLEKENGWFNSVNIAAISMAGVSSTCNCFGDGS